MKVQRFLVCSLFAVLLALPAGAQVGNNGDELTGAIGQHDLTAPLGGGGNVLYAPSEADDPAFRAAIAALTGGTVDYFDARAGTPDAATLSTYDCVHTWANFSFDDNVLYGDNLAGYVDGGGSVVLGAFTTFTTGNSMAGQIMDPGYSPVVSPTGTNHFSPSDYAGDGTTSIHDGVTAYDCVFRGFLALQGAGAQDGSYTDGEIAHSYRPDFQVIHSNGSGAAALGCGGQWAELVANACMAAGSASGTPIIEIPTLNAWSLMGLAVILMGVGVLFLRRHPLP